MAIKPGANKAHVHLLRALWCSFMRPSDPPSSLAAIVFIMSAPILLRAANGHLPLGRNYVEKLCGTTEGLYRGLYNRASDHKTEGGPTIAPEVFYRPVIDSSQRHALDNLRETTLTTPIHGFKATQNVINSLPSNNGFKK